MSAPCIVWDATCGMRCASDGCTHEAMLGLAYCPCHAVAAIGTKPIEAPPSAKQRLQISIASALLALGNLSPGREAALVRTKLEEAVMWLGRVPE